MAKSSNQKLKLIYLVDKLMRDTDENHGITISDMISYLEANGIKAERKSLYDDVALLTDYGYDIISEKKNRKTYYKMVSRDFELAELKLLVDSVQSAKFITTKKTEELIKKLESLASKHQAVELQRQVHVMNRVKNVNEKIYLYVDKLHSAIHKGCKVSFQYTSWNLKKELVPKHNGKEYIVNPFSLTWDDENYYLIAYDELEEKVKHFRVDKMLDLEELEQQSSNIEVFGKFDIAEYSKKTFGMFGGDHCTVKLKVANYLVGVILDRFGKEVMIIPAKDGEHFTVNVEVALSDQFIGWVIGLGKDVEVVSPDELKTRMVSVAEDMLKKYN